MQVQTVKMFLIRGRAVLQKKIVYSIQCTVISIWFYNPNIFGFAYKQAPVPIETEAYLLIVNWSTDVVGLFSWNLELLSTVATSNKEPKIA